VATAICSSAAVAQNGREHDFNMPAQELAASLREVAARTGSNLVAPSTLLAGRRARPLAGRYSARKAIELLLEGSGLTVRAVGDALVVAPVSAAAQQGSAEVPRGDGSAEADGGTIVVTGTNIRGAEPMSQIISIDRSQIERSGATSVEQLMRNLPQNSQSGVTQENFTSSGAGGDPTDHGAGLNLRGLGQRATLVLLNGRRLAPSSGGSYVDVSLIPLTAIERVEVLTDGASAIYGSDAVGGVVNFILKERFEGIEASLLAGTATEGDGDQLQAGLTGGAAWAGGSALLAYEYRREDEIRARDRDYTINFRPDTFILPRERRHSLLGVVRQELTPDLSFVNTGTYARRNSDRTFFYSGFAAPVEQEARAEAYSLSGELRYLLGGGWLARLEGVYSASLGSQLTRQPEGDGLINDRDTRNRSYGVGLKLDGSILDLPAGPLRLAAGVEVRRETFRDVNSTALVTNNVREGRRSVRSGFGELLVPLFSSRNRVPGIERLQLGAAARYERYSGTGSTVDPKLGILWSPVRGLDLRASYDTSFRAPLLSELLGAYLAVYAPPSLVYVDPDEATGLALVLGNSNPDVRPETSRTWTAGLELSPRTVPGLSLAFNYYSIRFSDRIAMPSPTFTVVGNPAFEPIVNRNPSAAEVAELVAGADIVLDISGPGFSNGGARPENVTIIVDDRVSNTAVTRTRGFDLLLRHSFSLGADAFLVEGNLNHVIDFTDRLTSESPAVRVLDTPYQPLDWRGRLAVSWTRNGWSASIAGNHADAYRDNRTSDVRKVASHTTIDAGIAYSFPDRASWLGGTRIGLFVQNLLDNDPPRLAPDPGLTTGLGYDPVNASGRGRFVSFQVRKAW
jgi:outer membrane receptor protein involved in Fe transport